MRRPAGTALWVLCLLVAAAYLIGWVSGAPWAGQCEMRDAVLFLLAADANRRLCNAEEADYARKLEREAGQVHGVLDVEQAAHERKVVR